MSGSTSTAGVLLNDGLPATGDKLIDEVRRRFQRAVEFEGVARPRFVQDVKFANADSDNHYQWPAEIRQARGPYRPCLTMNVTRQHNLQIVNDGKQSPAVVNIRPVGNGATTEAANMYRGVVREIEARSRAQNAYETGRQFQIEGGIGWWRIVTEYESDDTFDQVIKIAPVPDPFSVYYDPDAREKDKTDMAWAFVFDTVPREEWAEAYPKFAHLASLSPIGLGEGDLDDSWVGKGQVRICEYFRKVTTRDQMISFLDETGSRKQVRKSLFPANGLDDLLAQPGTKVRDIFPVEIQWKLIVGSKLIDETVWPGKYIPLVPCVGEETIIDGIMDRKGHTRALKDAQRMFNYNASAQVEFVALQTKTPWIGAVEAVEEYEEDWNTANIQNKSILRYKGTSDDGTPLPPPTRTDPPNASPAFEAGMGTAFNQMMMVSGQWQNQMGMGGNERTGEAITARQGQGDTATYHFRANYEGALVTTGMMLVDLIPRIYDTARVITIQADDGEDLEVEIDPAAKKAFDLERAHDQQVVRRVFNPKVGKYWVTPQPGAAYGTRREETVQAMTLILTQAPQLAGVIGDLLLQAMDFKEAKEAAMRLKRMVPPQALGTGPSEAEQQMQLQIGQLSAALEQALGEVAKGHLKLLSKEQLRNVDVYEAETKRMTALGESVGLDPAGLKAVVKRLMDEAMETSLTPIIEANADELERETIADRATDDEPIVPGAKKAPDGQWYLPDPTRPGSWLHVAPKAQGEARG